MKLARFIQQVQEAHGDPFRGGRLYHGTDPESLALILLSNRLTVSIDHQDGVSLTPSLIGARGWAERSVSIFGDNHGGHAREVGLTDTPSGRGAVLALDGDRLAQDYKLAHWVDPEYGQEDEVRVQGEITNLRKYLIGIEYDPEDCLWFARYLESPLGKQDYTNPERIVAELKRLGSEQPRSLTEASTAVEVRAPGGGSMLLRVQVDPTDRWIEQTVRAGQPLRGLSDRNRVWVWPADKAIHSQVRDHFGLGVNDKYDRLVFSMSSTDVDWPQDAARGSLRGTPVWRLREKPLVNPRVREWFTSAMAESSTELVTRYGDRVQVQVDPTDRWIAQQVLDGEALRGLADAKHLWVWPAGQGIHYDVRNELGLRQDQTNRLVFWAENAIQGSVRGTPVWRSKNRDILNDRVHGWFGMSESYQPEPDAPVDGEFVYQGDSATHWRQRHDALLKKAIQRWLGWPSDARLHVDALVRGEGMNDPSGSGKQRRAEAAALLWELQNKGRSNPVLLYRGDLQEPPKLGLASWTEDEKTAREFAKRASPTYGRVLRAEPGTVRGLRLADYIPGYDRKYGEGEWIIQSGLNEAAHAPEHRYFRDYMQAEPADHYGFWYEFEAWFADHEEEYDEQEQARVREVFDEDEAESFHEMPPRVQSDFMQWIKDHGIPEQMQHDPSEAPTWAHAGYTKKVPAGTWLIHFTDQNGPVAQKGFRYGTHDMTRLGLTTYTKQSGKTGGGYNFAFLADSREAENTASAGKYGANAVMFQHAGELIYHHGDEEYQVVFWGPSVDPRGLIILDRTDDGWTVLGRDSRVLFKGEFSACVEWVQKNHFQYRRLLYGGAK